MKVELDSMIKFLVSEISKSGSVIMKNYLKKQKTVKLSTIKSAIEVLLKGELRSEALEAADRAIRNSHLLKAKKKEIKEREENTA